MADEKYQLQLEGDQIDDALMQMFLRVPEGWTKGTRDGVPVGNTSEYYHNNAEWFAQQAADAAARAEAAVPAGTAGAVFFDRVQTLTSAQQEQARQNIKAGGSNPNLIMNPWFIVNQRGFTNTSSNNTMTVDRWLAQNMRTSGVCSYSNGIITLDATNAVGGGLTFAQAVDIEEIAGRTVTLSVMLADGNVYNKSVVLPARGTSQTTVISEYIGSTTNIMRLYVNGSISQTPYNVQLIVPLGNILSIKAVKLELGSVSTLANDMPPTYAEELAKCQRYFVRLKSTLATAANLVGDFALSATAIDFIIALPQSLAKIPTITQAGVQAVTVTGTVVPITSISAMDIIANNVRLRAYGTFTQNTYYKLTISQNSYIDLSADL